MKLGSAFSDTLVSGSRKDTVIRPERGAWWLGAGRVIMFTVVLAAAFFVLLIRLADLTLVRGYRYRVLAEANRTRELVRHAPRGILRDRSGQPLVDNIITYRLLKPCAADEKTMLGGCREYLTKEEGDRLAAGGLASGNFLETDFRRRYRMPEAVAHVVGYTGEVSGDEVEKEYFKLHGYKSGDRIGRFGAEAIFEDRLRGRDGKELVEVDSANRLLRMLGRDAEIPGTDVTLSLDAALVQVVADAFPSGTYGAVIVSKPATGEILAMYSSPSFDPNGFSMGMTDAQYTALKENPALPMLNRAIAGVYPPGSTYKMVTAMAGLESGKISSKTMVMDTGILRVGKFSFANWYFTQYGRTEGAVNLVRGLARSNDIYFYTIGKTIGIDTLSGWSKKIGLGKVTGIELAGESAGLVPDTAWKNERFTSASDMKAGNNRWYDGDTYHMAIGQGYLLTTPLQVNQWTNLVATGQICRPTIEKTNAKSHPPRCRTIELKPETRTPVIQGMVDACDTGGTGWPLFGFGVKHGDTPVATGSVQPLTRIPVACKTGTAEIGDPKGKTHAWFTVFAPVPEQYAKNVSKVTAEKDRITGDPEISVTVLVEKGGEGSGVAAPVAKRILEAWFGR